MEMEATKVVAVVIEEEDVAVVEVEDIMEAVSNRKMQDMVKEPLANNLVLHNQSTKVLVPIQMVKDLVPAADSAAKDVANMVVEEVDAVTEADKETEVASEEVKEAVKEEVKMAFNLEVNNPLHLGNRNGANISFKVVVKWQVNSTKMGNQNANSTILHLKKWLHRELQSHKIRTKAQVPILIPILILIQIRSSSRSNVIIGVKKWPARDS
jgi:hypothetical protein